MLIGIVGKANTGKSTFLNALCMTDAKMGNYPFTTIEPNRGVAYVRVSCPCKTLDTACNPRTGKCEDGIRMVPIEMLDVAGLVPGASEGRGMGNKFLDDLRRADALIHVVDASGATDAEGNIVDDYNPVNDIIWLNDELGAWISNILFKDWDKMSRRLDAERTKITETITDKLSGLGAKYSSIRSILGNLNMLEMSPRQWTNEQRDLLATKIREHIMPSIIAANKADRPSAPQKVKDMISTYEDMIIIPTTGLAELALRKADEQELIKYIPGETTFKVLLEDEIDNRLKTVMAIKERMFDNDIATGVMEILETCVYKILNLIPVFPVEDATHLADQDGRILPDVFLVPSGTTAKEFAGKIHTDFEKSFIHGILVSKSSQRISATYELQYGDIVKIIAAAK
jgi:ribosome-binding ATPase YchF (GTP1/OBG family)